MICVDDYSFFLDMISVLNRAPCKDELCSAITQFPEVMYFPYMYALFNFFFVYYIVVAFAVP